METEDEINENPKNPASDSSISWTHFKLPKTVRVPGYYEPRVLVSEKLRYGTIFIEKISEDNINDALANAIITALSALHKEAVAAGVKCGFVYDLNTLVKRKKINKETNAAFYNSLLNTLETKITSNDKTPSWIQRIAQDILDAGNENLIKMDGITKQANQAYQSCLNYPPTPLKSYPDHYKDMLKTTTTYNVEQFFQDYCNPTVQGGNTHKFQFFLDYKKWSRHHTDLAQSLLQEIQSDPSNKLKILENYRTHLLIKLHNEGRKPANSHLLRRIDFALEKLKLDVQSKTQDKKDKFIL